MNRIYWTLVALSLTRLLFGALVAVQGFKLLLEAVEELQFAIRNHVNGMQQKIIRGAIRDNLYMTGAQLFFWILACIGLIQANRTQHFSRLQVAGSVIALLINAGLWMLQIARYKESVELKSMAHEAEDKLKTEVEGRRVAVEELKQHVDNAKEELKKELRNAKA